MRISGKFKRRSGILKRHRLKWLIISGVVVILVSVLLLSGGIAFALTSIEGFNDILQGILNSQIETNNSLLRLFEMILP